MIELHYSDARCPMCQGSITIEHINKEENGESIEFCHCYNCDMDIKVERDAAGTISDVYLYIEDED